MKNIIALVVLLALGTAHAADEKKTEAKKDTKPKPAAKSDKNAAQKAEASVGKWARENHIWGKPRPGDKQ
jgi:hypothetical protein